MGLSISTIRIAIQALVMIAFVVFVYFVVTLLVQLERLSNVEYDNNLWTLSQSEIELLALEKALDTYLMSPESIQISDVQVRSDVFFARLSILIDGSVRTFAASDPLGTEALANLNQFRDSRLPLARDLADISNTDLMALKTELAALQPELRNLALQTLAQITAQEEIGRDQFRFLLQMTFLFGTLIIVALSLLLIILQRALAAARQQDELLTKSSRRLSSMVSASLDGIITADKTGRVVGFNEAAELILGWSKEDVIGTLMHETFIPKQHRAAHVAGMEHYTSTGTKRVIDQGRVEMTALRKTGEEFPIELNITSADGPDGEIFIAYLRDISDRKINEQNLVDARDRAERTDKAKSQFLTIMSHEMRTPLNGIMGVLDLLKTTRMSKKQERYVEIASASSEILMEHVNEAIDITRIETGEIVINEAIFDPVEIITSVTNVLEPLAAEKDLTLKTQIDPAMDVKLIGDGQRIRQIVTNLVGNAIKFTAEGQVEVALNGIHGSETTSLDIVVSDTGIGIDEDLYEEVFEDFFALNTPGDQHTRGDGLGLPISRRIARLMGGDVKVQSTPGKGSVFTLSMKLYRATELLEGSEDTGGVAALPATPKEVLIIEDNSVNRAIISDMVRNLGQNPTLAENGEVGVEHASKKKFDTILMDISMPVMDGITATKMIRQGNGPNRDTYILGLTAYGKEDYGATALEAGMNGLHGKPLRIPALRSLLVGSSVPGVSLAEGATGIDTDVLSELVSVLGAEKTRQTVVQFFEEMEGFLGNAQAMQHSGNLSRFAAEAHKMRGSAAMLGFADLAEQLDHAIAASKSDPQSMNVSMTRIDELCRKSLELVEAELGPIRQRAQ